MNKSIVSLRNVVGAALAFSALLAGCSTIQVGRPFNYEQFAAKATPGTTDLAQVQAILGQPMGKGLVAEADGSLYDQWTYYFGSGTMGAGDKSSFKLLQIRFDQSGKLASYNWSGDMAGSAPAPTKK